MNSKTVMVTHSNALPDRREPIVVSRPHLTLGTSMSAPTPDSNETAFVAMGCFWGAERKFFELRGVKVTCVGYQGGFTANPTYQDVCTGQTGHAEVVKVVFDPQVLSYADVLGCFFENHDPTQGYRQGNDVGTQYRSVIYFTSERQERIARSVTSAYGEVLCEAGYGPITTEIAPAGPFYMAEEYHQQYLVANPNGYCGIGGVGVSCPVGLSLD
ncbi:MAG: peptide-methionine (S)-S-oxide reductase MsrA [Acidobacteria bacterium]|nr:peptide-methionine (S)-S-oxide reductase MsrA [Acidobacteriota bacterium]